MAAPLYDLPLVEYQDLIAELAAAHPVGDIDPSLGFNHLLEAVDIREYDEEAYRALFSVVFQDFKLLAFSVWENITAGFERDDDKGSDDIRRNTWPGRPTVPCISRPGHGAFHGCPALSG